MLIKLLMDGKYEDFYESSIDFLININHEDLRMNFYMLDIVFFHKYFASNADFWHKSFKYPALSHQEIIYLVGYSDTRIGLNFKFDLSSGWQSPFSLFYFKQSREISRDRWSYLYE
jgi:hypothetical protein